MVKGIAMVMVMIVKRVAMLVVMVKRIAMLVVMVMMMVKALRCWW